MNAKIAHFRQSKHITSGNQMIVLVDGVTSKEEASKLVGKTVTYKTGKKDITGTVASPHGNKGALRVVFETGMPGQSIAQTVTLS